MRSKARSASRVRKSAAISRMRRRSGSVIRRKMAARPAPSTSAASYSSPGIAEEPRVAEQGDEGHRAPHVGEDQPREGQRGIAEPVDLAAAEEEVHEPRRGVIEPLEHLRRHDGGQRPGEQQEAEGERAGRTAAPTAGAPRRGPGSPRGRPTRRRRRRDARRAPEARVREQERDSCRAPRSASMPKMGMRCWSESQSTQRPGYTVRPPMAISAGER